ncbi:MAG: 2-succinyl-5-enolpyruvyl-6-hydroxy-3-cyclohexene-1-carboxylic-acid synthase [Opitutales bacterium]|nr:2-succinyl-5-enolpyruvyl-6-hydroxy-3-cyclohexene-1-carboxylic-acid synthase [Opitutales bacterium]
MNDKDISQLLDRAEFLANTNSLWGAAFVLRLQRLGVTRFVVSPGSRNTPLVFALAELPGHAVQVVVDERSAGFVALGWSKASGKAPVALVCTSGSALGHYLPALIEARYSHTPLVVISADRPPELQECHAGQTVDQAEIFGHYVGGFYAAPLPDFSNWDAMQTLLDSAAQFWSGDRALASVHINQPFRDPLTPGVPDGSDTFLLKDLLDLRSFLCEVPTVASEVQVSELSDSHHASLLIIIGPQELSWTHFSRAQSALKRLAKMDGVVIASDGVSSVRFSGIPSVAAYDLVLRQKDMLDALRPERIWLIGDLPTSKPLRAAVAHWNAPVVSFQADDDQRHAGIDLPWTVAPIKSLEHAIEGIDVSDTEFKSRWMEAEQFQQGAIQNAVAECVNLDCLREWQLPRLLVPRAPEGTRFLIASSMPVRDWEAFAPSGEFSIDVFSNRGANGIDGLISTAAGMALEDPERPVWLIIGDVATQHDLGGLATLAALPGTVTIWLINNGGGRIFDFLPISGVSFDFERFYHTPPQLNFAGLAEGVGLGYKQVKNVSDIKRIAESSEQKCLVEILVDSESDQAARRALTEPGN